MCHMTYAASYITHAVCRKSYWGQSTQNSFGFAKGVTVCMKRAIHAAVGVSRDYWRFSFAQINSGSSSSRISSSLIGAVTQCLYTIYHPGTSTLYMENHPGRLYEIDNNYRQGAVSVHHIYVTLHMCDFVWLICRFNLYVLIFYSYFVFPYFFVSKENMYILYDCVLCSCSQ